MWQSSWMNGEALKVSTRVPQEEGRRVRVRESLEVSSPPPLKMEEKQAAGQGCGGLWKLGKSKRICPWGLQEKPAREACVGCPCPSSKMSDLC